MKSRMETQPPMRTWMHSQTQRHTLTRAAYPWIWRTYVLQRQVSLYSWKRTRGKARKSQLNEPSRTFWTSTENLGLQRPCKEGTKGILLEKLGYSQTKVAVLGSGHARNNTTYLMNVNFRSWFKRTSGSGNRSNKRRDGASKTS
jgi:hypothetical protein